MPTYQLTSPSTLLVTFTDDEAEVVARAQQEGVAGFTTAVDGVIARFRERYAADDQSRMLNLFGLADAATRARVFTVLEGDR